MPYFGAPCDPLAGHCNASCNIVYCKCIHDITKQCLSNRDVCKRSGDSDETCAPNFAACFGKRSYRCGYDTIKTVTSTATDTILSYLPDFPFIPSLLSKMMVSEALKNFDLSKD
ncbi:hypothetical protein BsWGS_22082 [Bradybaena similaris]